jgi:putative ABC transport system permease protein
VYGGNNWNTSIVGTTPSYFSIRGWNVDSGNLFTDADIRSASRVALVGKTVVENVFGDDVDPIGKTIRIKKSPFLIVGILEAKAKVLMDAIRTIRLLCQSQPHRENYLVIKFREVCA